MLVALGAWLAGWFELFPDRWLYRTFAFSIFLVAASTAPFAADRTICNGLALHPEFNLFDPIAWQAVGTLQLLLVLGFSGTAFFRGMRQGGAAVPLGWALALGFVIAGGLISVPLSDYLKLAFREARPCFGPDGLPLALNEPWLTSILRERFPTFP